MFVLVDSLSVVASLVSSGSPQPVRLVVNGLTVGQPVEATAVTDSGDSWPVPGGVFVADAAQVVLVDNRAPLNTPVRYRVTVAGVVYTSNPVTVPYSGRHVIQSLDGRSVVPFVWRDNGLPRDLAMRASAFEVPGRRRPPVRFAPGGVGGGELEIRTSRAASRTLEELLLTGRPLVVRTDGTVRDFQATEIVLPQSARSTLWGAGGTSTDRVWSLPYLLVDDPEPSAALSAYTWDDFDEAMSGLTWDGFDALFAVEDWDSFDAYDWEQL